MYNPKLQHHQNADFKIFRKGSFHFVRNCGKQLHSFPVQIQFKFLPFPFKGNTTATQGRGSVMLYHAKKENYSELGFDIQDEQSAFYNALTHSITLLPLKRLPVKNN